MVETSHAREREDPRELRERKLAELQAIGLPLLPNRYGPTRPTDEIKRDCIALEGSRVRVAGRLMRIRGMGKASFAHLQDRAGDLQLYFKRDVLGEELYRYFKLLDLGDIVGVEGTIFKTKTGEISLQVQDVILLAKAFLPLPDKFHGLADVEERYRRRYLDLIANPESREAFRVRIALVRGIRRYLDDRGFDEVETPILQPVYGGATANPFITDYAELDMQAYLRIATELYLKRLIVAGMERVYEIGKDFRNEGFSRKHSPEFTMIELYQAYADYEDIMALTEEMISTVALDVLGAQRITFDGHEVDLAPPWRRLSVREALLECSGIDLERLEDAKALRLASAEAGISLPEEMSRGKMIDELVTEFVEPRLVQPTMLYDFPIDFPGSLLAKRKADEPGIVERFEPYIGGMEIGNGFTELNDAADQLDRMKQAAQLRGEEFQLVDYDYLRALSHGMPPTGGLGLGIDRIAMLLTGAHHIRETILFPLLRPREDDHVEP
ncbi:MAG: lysine--tRNA ligase [Chloroflexota bacterium]